jgi:hypothetical protein
MPTLQRKNIVRPAFKGGVADLLRPQNHKLSILVIFSIKTKYLASSYFPDIVNVSELSLIKNFGFLEF